MIEYKTKALGENDIIRETPIAEKIVLEEGDYKFRIVTFSKELYDGGDKLPPCKKYVFDIRVFHGNDSVDIEWKYFHVESLAWKIINLLKAVGLRKTGEEAPVPWSAISGTEGICHVIKKAFDKKDGKTGYCNEIEKFIEAEAPAAKVAAPVKDDENLPF